MMMWGSPLLLACVAWRFCRAGRRSGVATKNSRAKRARTSGEAARKIKTKLLPLPTPHGFSALARLYYLVRPIKTAMLRRLLFSPCRYLHVSYTVKPESRHLRDLPKCPLNKGCKHCTMFVTDQNSPLTLYCDKVAC